MNGDVDNDGDDVVVATAASGPALAPVSVGRDAASAAARLIPVVRWTIVSSGVLTIRREGDIVFNMSCSCCCC